jgi:hypothetical protein
MRAACRIAASVLTKVATERGSKDNITVILVDLRSGSCQRPGSALGDNLAEKAGTPASAAGTPPTGPQRALRRTRSQDYTKQLLQEVSGDMPIRRASRCVAPCLQCMLAVLLRVDAACRPPGMNMAALKYGCC